MLDLHVNGLLPNIFVNSSETGIKRQASLDAMVVRVFRSDFLDQPFPKKLQEAIDNNTVPNSLEKATSW